MAISQITSSNTFAQWLAATQSLISKQNYVEDSYNVVIQTANTSVNVYNNTVSVYNTTLAVSNNTVNTYNNTVSVYNTTLAVSNNTVNTYNNTVSVFNSTQAVSNNTTNTYNDTVNTYNLTVQTKSDTVNTYNSTVSVYNTTVGTYNDTVNTYNLTVQTKSDTVNTYNDTVSVFNSTQAVSNNTTNTYNDTVNTYNLTISTKNDTVNTYNSTVQVYNSIQAYVAVAFDSANAASVTANNANNVSYQALSVAEYANNVVANINVVTLTATTEAAYAHANGAFDKANTFSQNTFVRITVPGQSDIVANANNSVFTVSPGPNVSITTDNITNTITIDSVGGGGTATGDVSPTPDTVVQRDSNGDAFANNFISSSDIRLKDNIRTIENATDIVSQLRGVHFNWKNTNNQQIGLIAQEVERVLPQIVYGEDPKMINYPVIVAVLIEAVKDLTERVKNLENK